MKRNVPVLAALALMLGVTGVVRPAGGHRRLDIDPAHPFHLRWGDRQALTIWRSDKGFDWRCYLDVIAANGFNYIRQDATAWTGLTAFRRYGAQFSRPRWAFIRTGPGAAVDGQPRFDLARFDGDFFRERLVPFLREAERRSIIVELTLFDSCRSRRAFADSLYAPSNNVNDLGLRPGDDPHADAALHNPRLRAVQEAYVARVLEASRAFRNVIYEVVNESGARWVAHYDPVTGQCDLVVKHRVQGGDYRSDADVARHRAALMRFRLGNRPVLHNEFFLFAQRATDNLHFVRKMLWADCTGVGQAASGQTGNNRPATEEQTPAKEHPQQVEQAQIGSEGHALRQTRQNAVDTVDYGGHRAGFLQAES